MGLAKAAVDSGGIMPGRNGSKRGSFIDKFAEAATPKVDSSDPSGRSAWWWIFFMPGKVILWIEYMFPERIVGVFGSARRRNVPLIQVQYSLYFYFVLFALGLYLFIVTRTH
jgi:hypothetical protein